MNRYLNARDSYTSCGGIIAGPIFTILGLGMFFTHPSWIGIIFGALFLIIGLGGLSDFFGWLKKSK
jgi:hypothetical protein